MKFEFPTDEEGQLFCEEIVGKMCENYGIDEIEAVTRVSDFWRGQTLFEDDIAFHNLNKASFWSCFGGRFTT